MADTQHDHYMWLVLRPDSSAMRFRCWKWIDSLRFRTRRFAIASRIACASRKYWCLDFRKSRSGMPSGDSTGRTSLRRALLGDSLRVGSWSCASARRSTTTSFCFSSSSGSSRAATALTGVAVLLPRRRPSFRPDLVLGSRFVPLGEMPATAVAGVPDKRDPLPRRAFVPVPLGGPAFSPAGPMLTPSLAIRRARWDGSPPWP